MEKIRYMSSLLSFYLKGEISSEQNFIRFVTPEPPFGKKTESVPVTQIASVSSDFKLKPKKLLIGFLIFILTLYMFTKSFLIGLILLIVSAHFILDGFEIDLDVHMTSGKVRHIDFLILDKKKADLAAEQINAMISARLSDTNTREQTDRILDALKNK